MWFWNLLKRVFGFGDDEEKVTPPAPSPVPIDPHEPPAPVPVQPPPPIPPDVTPVPPPAPPGDAFTVDMTIKGEPVVIRKNEFGNTVPTQVVVSGKPGSRIPVEFVIDMEYVGDAALLAQLVETQAFRDTILLPGTAWLEFTAWPYTAPRFLLEDVKIVGTVEGRPGGWARVVENKATHKEIYLANITEKAVRFTFTLPLVVSANANAASYAVIKGHLRGAYGDDRPRWFEIWLNRVNADY